MRTCIFQVVPGTHRCGRIDHDLVAGQTAANQEQVDMILERYPLVYAEAEPGTGKSCVKKILIYTRH